MDRGLSALVAFLRRLWQARFSGEEHEEEDIQESRIRAVLGDDEEHVSEEFYVLGPGEKEEYERLKKTQPSSRIAMTFSKSTGRSIPNGCSSVAKTFAALVRRKLGGRQFYLGLAELKATDRKSNNYQLLHDCVVWFVNSR